MDVWQEFAGAAALRFTCKSIIKLADARHLAVQKGKVDQQFPLAKKMPK
jgi:hypothetical protein